MARELIVTKCDGAQNKYAKLFPPAAPPFLHPTIVGVIEYAVNTAQIDFRFGTKDD